MVYHIDQEDYVCMYTLGKQFSEAHTKLTVQCKLPVNYLGEYILLVSKYTSLNL